MVAKPTNVGLAPLRTPSPHTSPSRADSLPRRVRWQEGQGRRQDDQDELQGAPSQRTEVGWSWHKSSRTSAPRYRLWPTPEAERLSARQLQGVVQGLTRRQGTRIKSADMAPHSLGGKNVAPEGLNTKMVADPQDYQCKTPVEWAEARVPTARNVAPEASGIPGVERLVQHM